MSPSCSHDPAWWYNLICYVPGAAEARGHKCGDKDMLILLSYDIREPKRLGRVAKICEAYGVRIQYSVFECRLQADVFEEFWQLLNDQIDPNEDRITAFRVCVKCAQHTRDAGQQEHFQRVVAYVF